MRYSLLARIGSVVLLALLGALAVATVRADDPDAWEFVDLWVEVRKEARADVIEFRLAGDGLTARTGTPENRFVRVHEGWLHYWLPSSPITVREGLQARIVARLVEQPYLTVKLSGNVTGSADSEVFGSGAKASGGVLVSSEALQWELSARMVRVGLQLSFDGQAWTEPLEFKQRFHYQSGSICVTDFPGLDQLDDEIEIAGVSVQHDNLCIGNGLRSSQWRKTGSLTIPAQLSMFPATGAPEVETEAAATEEAVESTPPTETQTTIPDAPINTDPAAVAGTISAGRYHSCALTTDGTISCWGWNNRGQTDAPDGTFSQISSGGYHTCAIATDDSLSCWGYSGYGQTDTPLGTFSQVSAGERHSCAVASDGSLSCWGWNEYRQTDTPLGTFSQVSAGFAHTCAIATDRSISCWGWNHAGQTDAPDGAFSQVSASYNHTCALATDGSISCWGFNQYGKADAPDDAFSQVSVGSDHTCAIASDDSLSCWGSNSVGQTDAPDDTFSQVSAGSDHTCTIAVDGSVSCWGQNNYWQALPPQNLRRPNAVSP